MSKPIRSNYCNDSQKENDVQFFRKWSSVGPDGPMSYRNSTPMSQLNGLTSASPHASSSVHVIQEEDNFQLDDDDDYLELCTQISQEMASLEKSRPSAQSTQPILTHQLTDSQILMMPPPLPPPQVKEQLSVEIVEEQEEEDKSQGTDKKPPKECLLEHIWIRQNIGEIEQFIKIMIETTKTHKELFFETDDIYLTFLKFSTSAICDQYFSPLAKSLYHFFEQAIFICNTYFQGKMDNAACNWFNLAIDFANSLKAILKQARNGKMSLNLNILSNLVPMVLSSNIVLCLIRYPIQDLELLFELYTEVYESLYLVTDSIEADDLIYFIVEASKYYEFISNLLIIKTSSEKVKLIGQLICSHILYVPVNQKGERSIAHVFKRIMGNQLVRAIALKLEITIRDLFLGLVKKISKRLIVLICSDGLPCSIVQDCMTFFFDFNYMPGELLRYMVPRFATLHNELTRKFFKYLEKNGPKKNSITSLMIKYLTDIVAACFYKSNYSNDFLCEVFTFLNAHVKRNLLEDVYAKQEETRQHFMLNFSKDQNASLAGLSFVYFIDKIFSNENREASFSMEIIRTQVKLNYFCEFPKSREIFLRVFFPNCCDAFRSNLMNITLDNIGLGFLKKKVIYLQSFRLLLELLDKENLLQHFQVEIYHVIKFIFGNRQRSETESYQLQILSTFIRLAKPDFIRSEIASICLLIMPFVKLLPDMCVSIYRQLILERDHPIDVYYELYFVSDLPKAESLTAEIKAKIVAHCGQAELDISIGRIRMTSDISPEQNPTQFDTHKMILYLGEKEFGCFCREMLYPLQHLTRSDQALHPVALRKIKRMISNSEFDLFFSEPVVEGAKDVILDFGIDRSDTDSTRTTTSTGSTITANNSGSAEFLWSIQPLVDSIHTVGDFFHCLVLTLLKSIKYSSSYCRNIALDCLGVLGAVNSHFLGTARPSLASDSTLVKSTDFCHQAHFDPRKKEFKLLLLETLASMLGNTTQAIDFNLIAFGLQKLQPVFREDNHEVIERLLNLPEQGSAQGSQHNPIRSIFYFRKRISQYLEEKFPGQTKEARTNKAKLEYKLVDILTSQMDMAVDSRRDMKGPLRDVVLAFDKGNFNLRPPKPEITSVDTFFDKVNPTMTFKTFLAEFIDMLYGCFIYPAQNTDTGELFEPDTGPAMEYEQILSQKPCKEAQIPHPGDRNDWDAIYGKLKELRVPKAIFFICSFKLTGNSKLYHLLLPSLLILSLDLASKQLKKTFIDKFEKMIGSMIRNDQYFTNELGPMFVELLCALFDFLAKWCKNREFLHQHIIGALFLKQRVDRFDTEYNGVKMFLKSLPIPLMVHLTYQAKLYHRSLYYLETFLDNKHDEKNDIRNCLDYFRRIYSALGDKDSLDAVKRFHSATPTLDSIFLQASSGAGTTTQVIAGAKLLALDSFKPITPHFDSKNIADAPQFALNSDNQQRYIASLCGLQQDLARFWRDPSELMMPNLEKYKIEAAMEMNSWSALVDIFDKRRDSFGSNQPAPSKTYGHILAGFYNELPAINMEEIIGEVRDSFMPSLNAAMLSNCETAYARAYSASIVPLHILKDMDDFREFLRFYMKSSEKELASSIFNRQLKIWRTRNRLLPQASGDRLSVLSVQKAMIQLMQTKYQARFDEKYCSTLEYFRYLHECMSDSLVAADLDVAYGNAINALHVKYSNETRENIEKALSPVESVEFSLNLAKVFWCRGQSSEAIRFIKSEIDKKYRHLQRHAYKTLLLCEKYDNLEAISDALEIPWEFVRQEVKNVPPSGSKEFARLQLQYARYCGESRLLEGAPAELVYQAAVQVYPNWEEGHYQLAMFYLRLVKEMQQLKQNIDSRTVLGTNKLDETIILRANIVCSLATSLMYDQKLVTISLPLMWETWISLGRELELRRANMTNQRVLQNFVEVIRMQLSRATKAIESMNQINSAIFFVIIDQIIANIANPCQEIKLIVSKLLAKLIANYHYHMAWQFARMRIKDKSDNRGDSRTHKTEQQRLLAQNCLNDAKKTSPSVGPYFSQFDTFIDKLEEMSKAKMSRSANRQTANVLTLSSTFPSLLHAFELLNRTDKLVLPCNNFFLPNITNLVRVSNEDLFDKFFKHIFIESIENNVAVMKSLQEPKKITFRCSDGKKREMLSKCNDDLRKDRCMLNFCNLYNECRLGTIPVISTMSQIDGKYTPGEELARWAERRRDPLQLQTYFVVPFSDNFGIIEMIPGLVTLKSLVEGEYTKTPEARESFESSKNDFLRAAHAIKSNDRSKAETRQRRIEVFTKHYSNFKPPVFQNWFKSFYLEPYSWWQARKNFTRTMAVYSMIGYVLGLGDRHAENILIDPRTGEVVHVDFNCLFNAGEEFVVPECVPFRLTQNLTAAMGVFGHEGLFRKTCEDVLLLMRQYRELFNIQVSSLLDDPLKDWRHEAFFGPGSDRIEAGSRSVFNVEARMFGIVSRSRDKKVAKGKTLSVEGQVDYLIKESTNLNNLGSMYYGWAAYI